MSCTAAWNQVAFRGRNDDGNETTATWVANQNANFSFAKDVNLRIRLEVQETAGCAGANKTWQLQYNRLGLGWNTVNGSSSVVRSTASPNLADAANLTSQLTIGTGTFQGATGFDEVNGAAGGNSMDLAASGHAEAEFCVQIRSADVASGDTIQLRITDNGSAFAAYDQTPTVTVSSGNVSLTPTTLALTTATFAPTVTASDHKSVTPTTASLTLSTFAPTVTIGVNIVPSTASLSLSTFAPTVTTTDHKTVTPTTKALTLTTFAPSVLTPVLVTPSTKALSLSTFAPTVTASDHKSVTPSTLALLLTAYAPTVTVGGAVANVSVTPSTLALILQTYAPTVTATEREPFRAFGGGGFPSRIDPKSIYKIKRRDEGPRAKLLAKIKAQEERDMRDIAGF